MTGRLLALITGGVTAVFLAVAAIAVVGGAASACPLPPSSGTASGYNAEQLHNAAIIVQVAVQRRLPIRAAVIAVATAIQESQLYNTDQATDHDSVGLFQQRPSQGWGTPQQLHNPEYAAGKFYDKLLTIANWQRLPLTVVAQAVQRSAYGNAYAPREADATAIVARVSSGNSSANPGDREHCLRICPPISSSAPADTPTANGDGDLTCSGTAFGSAEPAPRKPDGSWPTESCTIRPDPSTGNGCITPRTLHLVQQATAASWPKPGCFRVDDHGEHPKGRACDFMMTSGGEASGSQKARGDAMALWAVANADRLGIMYVIWFRMIWTPQQGWHAYNNPYGGDDPSGWHTNHVHISVY